MEEQPVYLKAAHSNVIVHQVFLGKTVTHVKVPIDTDIQIFLTALEMLPNFLLTFGNSQSTETLDYVLLNGFNTAMSEVTKKYRCISLS